MIEIKGDIWHFYEPNGTLRDRVVPAWIVVTTNGFVKVNGHAVMGRGTAARAAERFPLLPLQLGAKINAGGNRVHAFPKLRLISFPVKRHWKEPADLDLIRRSADELCLRHESGFDCRNCALGKIFAEESDGKTHSCVNDDKTGAFDVWCTSGGDPAPMIAFLGKTVARLKEEKC